MTLACAYFDSNPDKTLTIALNEDGNKFFEGFSKIELKLNGRCVTLESKEFFNSMIEIVEKRNE